MKEKVEKKVKRPDKAREVVKKRGKDLQDSTSHTRNCSSSSPSSSSSLFGRSVCPFSSFISLPLLQSYLPVSVPQRCTSVQRSSEATGRKIKEECYEENNTAWNGNLCILEKLRDRKNGLLCHSCTHPRPSPSSLSLFSWLLPSLSFIPAFILFPLIDSSTFSSIFLISLSSIHLLPLYLSSLVSHHSLSSVAYPCLNFLSSLANPLFLSLSSPRSLASFLPSLSFVSIYPSPTIPHRSSFPPSLSSPPRHIHISNHFPLLASHHPP